MAASSRPVATSPSACPTRARHFTQPARRAHAWTKGAARDLGPRGITVNLVHPGSTNTDMNPAEGPHAEAQRQRMAIKEYGRAEDVAALYAFIASPEARSVNGTGFTIDGGANA